MYLITLIVQDVKHEYRYAVKVKVSRYKPGKAPGVPGGYGSWIVSTFGTIKVEGRHPYAPAAFTPRSVPGTHF
jgi:hypothetical protein